MKFKQKKTQKGNLSNSKILLTEQQKTQIKPELNYPSHHPHWQEHLSMK